MQRGFSDYFLGNSPALLGLQYPTSWGIPKKESVALLRMMGLEILYYAGQINKVRGWFCAVLVWDGTGPTSNPVYLAN